MEIVDNNQAAYDYFLQDWLRLHEIGVTEVQDLLACTPNVFSDGHPIITPKTISASEAWAMSAQALCQIFPEHREIIETTRSHCDTHFDCQIERPQTHDLGQDQKPRVMVNYQGHMADIIAVAHEFGHALQIVANQSRSTPPILRELAAFISELALLNYTQNQQLTWFSALRSAWLEDHQRYLGEDLDDLQASLANLNAPYDYRWNYPVARLLAEQLDQQKPTKVLWQAMTGSLSLIQCLTIAAQKTTLRLDNYLPPVAQPDSQHPAINTYRHLGIAALLDMDYWQGLSEQTIGDYVAFIAQHLQSQTLLIATNQSQQPIGYIAWATDDDDKQSPQLSHQCAPFGDYLALQIQLKQHLSGSNMPVHAHHPSSARQEQLVWQS